MVRKQQPSFSLSTFQLRASFFMGDPKEAERVMRYNNQSLLSRDPSAEVAPAPLMGLINLLYIAGRIAKARVVRDKLGRCSAHAHLEFRSAFLPHANCPTLNF